MSKKLNIVKVVALTAILSAVTACNDSTEVKKEAPVKTDTANLKDFTQADGTTVKLAAKQELVRGNGTEVSTIDPQKSEGVPEANVIQDLFEGLVNQSAEGTLVPGVATSWETNDNKTFIFHLRKDAKWSNGDTVTANDFVYSFERAVDPVTASPYAWFVEMTGMVNATEIIAGKTDKSKLGVKAVDDYTLEMTLTHAVPYFPLMMAHTTMKPVHQATVEKFGDKWTRPENFVGNGAFVLNSWVVNERIEMVKSKQYWDNSNTKLTKVTFLPIENEVAEMNRFLSGEIDMTNGLPNEHFKRLKKEHAESLQIKGSLCTYYYNFNAHKAPFDDVRVRQAVSYAIDRNVITDIIIAQGQKPAYFLTPEIVADFSPELPAYGKMTQDERNAKAKALLLEAGYSDAHPLKFTLLYNTSENHKKIAVAIGSMWKKTLGVKVSLENQEWKTYLENKRAGNFDVARAGWCGDYNEASSFTSIMKSDNPQAGTAYKSAEYDKLVAAAQVAKTDADRQQIYYKQEALMAKDMPIAPIYQYVKTRLVNPHVGGYPTHDAEDKVYSKNLYIIEK